MEGKVNNSLIKFVSYILGTGLTAHAVYIYSLAYYQGYMQELGYPIELFPADSLLIHIWSNTASRDIAAQIIRLITSVGVSAILISLAVIVLIIPLSNLIKPIWPNKLLKTKLERELDELKMCRDASTKRGVKKFIAYICVFIKQLEFDGAYIVFNWVSLSIIPLMFICVAWLYFPDLAISQGGSLAKKHRSNFEKNLCGSKLNYWSRCYKFDVEYIPNLDKLSAEFEVSTPDIPKSTRHVVGNLIVKSNNYLALYTKNGPVVISTPPEIYLKAVKNPCYGKDDCNTEEQLLPFEK